MNTPNSPGYNRLMLENFNLSYQLRDARLEIENLTARLNEAVSTVCAYRRAAERAIPSGWRHIEADAPPPILSL